MSKVEIENCLDSVCKGGVRSTTEKEMLSKHSSQLSLTLLIEY